ncbi:DNA-binding response regulator, LytR/AlgR family [Pseudobutyrivibrio sp. 49]|uniref:LytR/AlgR family response regulator transcription factor n=1 Tax=Pseudobutyrivibrio sp. 49 TaxID=1855344 RepID=UPI000884A641|nr:LytTR family DNA-binding domain-containing protein [Pseudobutyrivibrio sp. 49]SDI52077.1 DNA-binding response regulator, LytR/AlgR family [Pseudobutyrivibrio sp. 49]
MKLVIVEDNEAACVRLKNIIYSWATTNNIECELRMFNSGEGFFAAKIKTDDICAFFLDIELGEMSGVDVAHRLRNNNYNGDIIFLTAFQEYVFQGYNVRAMNYILKPAEPTNVKKCLDEIYAKNIKEFYTYHYRSEVISIPYKDIICFISNLHNVETVTLSKTYIEHLTFNEIIDCIPGTFIQIHRSYIVNLSHVYRMTRNSVVLSNNMELSIGRSFAKSVSEKFIGYSTRLD